MEILNKDWTINISSNSKVSITFDTVTNNVKIDNLDVSFPWEYEKKWILLEVKEFASLLFYSFTIDSKHLVIISNDTFELKEEILSFFWDVDILIIIGSKRWAEIFENIEARVVIPYWPTKQMFLATLWQNIEEIPLYKVKSELSEDNNEFVNLAE
jgi:hypothetical protein